MTLVVRFDVKSLASRSTMKDVGPIGLRTLVDLYLNGVYIAMQLQAPAGSAVLPGSPDARYAGGYGCLCGSMRDS
jgi:hypothetical protein